MVVAKGGGSREEGGAKGECRCKQRRGSGGRERVVEGESGWWRAKAGGGGQERVAEGESEQWRAIGETRAIDSSACKVLVAALQFLSGGQSTKLKRPPAARRSTRSGTALRLIVTGRRPRYCSGPESG